MDLFNIKLAKKSRHTKATKFKPAKSIYIPLKSGSSIKPISMTSSIPEEPFPKSPSVISDGYKPEKIKFNLSDSKDLSLPVSGNSDITSELIYKGNPYASGTKYAEQICNDRYKERAYGEKIPDIDDDEFADSTTYFRTKKI